MCGIAGFFATQGRCCDNPEEVASLMAQKLVHRGPSGNGVWVDLFSGLALAHRRLSIVDLSEAGHQPMTSFCGRYLIVFNGEIYNHTDLRRKLEMSGMPLGFKGWRGHSDTETLLTSISINGLQKTLNDLVGMFAFALWDREEKSLFLVRDRLGEKPLYYGMHNGVFLFSSELKALRAYPGFQGVVNRNVLTEFLSCNFISAPNSIYQGIFKLPPGSWIKLTEADVLRQKLPNPSHYWSLADVVESGRKMSFQGGDAEAIIELERLLSQSIKSQMLADVPLGAFLSGGIDSTAIVALMQSQSVKAIKTFTIGFHEDSYNEAHHARAISTYLGTDHTDFYVTSDQARSVIPRLPLLYDEPFADVSQIPTFLVSELACKQVSVCLSGDGGDELFGGYNRHVFAASIWNKVGWLPYSLRFRLSSILKAVPSPLVDAYFSKLGLLFPRYRNYRAIGEKLHKIAELLGAESSGQIYSSLINQWNHPEKIVIGGVLSAFEGRSVKFSDIEHEIMFLDTISYLTDDILVKIDRAAMAVSLETRVPMLDHRLLEFAWSLPLDMKIRKGEGKWILRRMLERHVPAALTNRPKAGFGVPIDEWLRGPLKGWAEELIDPARLKKEGYFFPEPIRLLWKQHLDGSQNRARQLWSVLMFQSWLESNGG